MSSFGYGTDKLSNLELHQIKWILTSRDAAMMSMRRMIKGKNPEEIRELQKCDLEQPVTNHDFEDRKHIDFGIRIARIDR